jgi:transcriptional regulator with XRE-family HTH domain
MLTTLKLLRLERGLTLRSVQIGTGIHYSLLSRYENGVMKSSEAHQERLAGFYGMTISELFRDGFAVKCSKIGSKTLDK